ncbi:ABC transporter permease [Spirochaeta lutea]|uniref:ABC transporter permease n=1 Tax=Spirochaeta lutea TaxID=1480694 RepID=A0A098QTR9_9SPIO|nr:proline/glycine betaine ABC transporter permease [Spirochaeta lutea]KGE70788.1 ABC transporter permease [Spirochaeta lutea]
MNNIIPQIPLAEWVDSLLKWMTTTFSWLTRAFSAVVGTGIDWISEALLFIPPIILILAIGGLAWFISTRKIAIGSVIGLLFIWNLGLWEPTVSTITLVLLSTGIAVLVGVPLGIVAALNETFFKIVKPILDFMQTMPAFVYLIPAIPFFGLGGVSAIFATVIFSIPPAIRLTALGIKQIDKELIEACVSFGTTTRQKLFKVQMPLAMPTIMAGVNQTIMLSLSMTVIASMIGAGGLGGEVWRAIQRLRPGQGFAAGLGVVIVAIILDRITQHIGDPGAKSKKK